MKLTLTLLALALAVGTAAVAQEIPNLGGDDFCDLVMTAMMTDPAWIKATAIKAGTTPAEIIAALAPLLEQDAVCADMPEGLFK